MVEKRRREVVVVVAVAVKRKRISTMFQKEGVREGGGGERIMGAP